MINKRLRIQFVWFLALSGALLSCLSISWWINAQAHYGYAQFYDYYNIGEHIERFAPQNQYILGLNNLDKEEHIELFNQISVAVHNHGKGLADIDFKVQGKTTKLLHQAEVIHLQDVANLIDKLRLAAVVTLIMTSLLLAYLFRNKIKPKLKTQLLCLSLLVSFVVLMIFIVGPTKAFYQFHVWVFPDGHQWFFYYQESLMSTMMKAPDLFGGIAASIFTIGLILFALLLMLFSYLYRFLKFR